MTRLRILCLCLIVATVWADRSSAQDGKDKGDTKPPATDTTPAVEPALQQELATPQATLRTLLEGDPADAVECLDLTGKTLTPEAKRQVGRLLAYKLRAVIARMAPTIDYARVPADGQDLLRNQVQGLNDGEMSDVGLIAVKQSGDGLWRFTPETVDAIDDLHLRWRSEELLDEDVLADEDAIKPLPIWIEEQFPESLRQERHFLLPDYQWICILAVIFCGFLADLLARLFCRWLTALWFRVRPSEETGEDFRFWRPVGLLAQALVWYSGTKLVVLPPFVLTVLLVGLKFFAVVAAVWTSFHFIDLLARVIVRRAQRTDSRFDDLLVPLVSKSLKTLAVCVGVLQCAAAFNLPITGLLGGLGLGGMALALASKDAVSNVFGSLTVLVDRPFEVGDWVITEGIEGSVESVGFRSTRIRTFYNSLITVPNSRLTTASVDNMGRRRYRRIKATLGVEYGTTMEQVDGFCEGIRELIRRHPFTRKDYYHVYLNELGESSLGILLYCFLECPDWSVELREKHRLFADIIKLAERLDIAFAFPSRTLYMQQVAPPQPGDPLDDPAGKGKQLAAEIAGPLLEGDQRPGLVEFP